MKPRTEPQDEKEGERAETRGAKMGRDGGVNYKHSCRQRFESPPHYLYMQTNSAYEYVSE